MRLSVAVVFRLFEKLQSEKSVLGLLFWNLRKVSSDGLPDNPCQIVAISLSLGLPYEEVEGIFRDMGWSPSNVGNVKTGGRWEFIMNLFDFELVGMEFEEGIIVLEAMLIFNKGEVFIASKDHIFYCVDGIGYDIVDKRTEKVVEVLRKC